MHKQLPICDVGRRFFCRASRRVCLSVVVNVIWLFSFQDYYILWCEECIESFQNFAC